MRKKINTHNIPMNNLTDITRYINNKGGITNIYYVCGANILVPFIDSEMKSNYDIIDIGGISCGRSKQDIADIVFDNIMRNHNVTIDDVGFHVGKYIYAWG